MRWAQPCRKAVSKVVRRFSWVAEGFGGAQLRARAGRLLRTCLTRVIFPAEGQVGPGALVARQAEKGHR